MKSNIRYKGVELIVSYNYSKPEREIRYFQDGSGYPGSDAMAEIRSIRIKDVDVTKLLDKEIEEIEQKLIEQHES